MLWCRSLRESSACAVFVALGVALASLACDAAQDAPAGPRFDRPPIIIVDVDTLRADHLGSYGYARDTSPNIDRFAQETAHFDWAFSQGPGTAPSQSSILTGLYPTSHGRNIERQIISAEVETLAESLSAAGYATAAFVDGGLMARGFGLEQGFDIYDDQAGGLAEVGPRAEEYIESRLASDRLAALLSAGAHL